MATDTATLSENIWDNLRTILAADAVVGTGGTAGVNKIYGAYPQDFIDDASGLPFIVIHKPILTETRRTITKKNYTVSVDIEGFADNAAVMKIVSDGIRNALQSNQATTRASHFMFDFMITGDTEDFDLRGNKRIHRNVLTCQYMIIA